MNPGTAGNPCSSLNLAGASAPVIFSVSNRGFRLMTDEDWKVAKKLWAEGRDTLDIAHHFGVRECYIYNRLHVIRDLLGQREG